MAAAIRLTRSLKLRLNDPATRAAANQPAAAPALCPDGKA